MFKSPASLRPDELVYEPTPKSAVVIPMQLNSAPSLRGKNGGLKNLVTRPALPSFPKTRFMKQ